MEYMVSQGLKGLFQKVLSISVEHSNVDDKAAYALAFAWRQSKDKAIIRDFNLHNNKITKNGADKLAQAMEKSVTI